MPQCALQECHWWDPVELSGAGAEKGLQRTRVLSQLQTMFMATAKVRAGSFYSPPYFTFENPFFLFPQKNLMFYPAGPKSECVLDALGMTGPSVPGCAAVAQHSGLWELPVPQLLGHTEPEQGAHNH